MPIVSDTGPIRYLIETGTIDILPKLYGRILTTATVIGELQLPHFPAAVQVWVKQIPSWLTIEQPSRVDFLDTLDEGEASVLSLAIQLRADAILIDERAGTNVALANSISTIGTLAVLQEAGHAGLLDFYVAIGKLTNETRFRHSRMLIDQVVDEFERERVKRQNDRTMPYRG